MPNENERVPLETALYCPGIAVGWEDPSQLEKLARDLTAEHRPSTPTERSLVDSLIHTEWMLRRYRWLETEVWNAARQSLPPDQKTRSWPGHTWIAHPELGRIHRLRATAQRSFNEILNQLHRLRSTRSRPAPDPAHKEPETPLATEPLQNPSHPDNPTPQPLSIHLHPPTATNRPQAGASPSRPRRTPTRLRIENTSPPPAGVRAQRFFRARSG